MTDSKPSLFEEGAMTVRQAVAFSGISRSGLYELMSNGKLPWTNVGSRRLIPKSSLLTLLEESLQGGGR